MNFASQDPAYLRLKHDVIASTGLDFYSDRDDVLIKVIGERLAALGLGDCSSYARILADSNGGSGEMDTLIAQLTIGETSFFRDEDQFTALRDIIIPDILKRKYLSRRVRIWSAGCATGAEPYSLAILLMREFAHRTEGWRIHIYATDLNRMLLTQAAEGRFRAWALRSTSEEVKQECFSKQGLVWTIHPRYKEWISFHHLNLVQSEFSTPLPAGARFDLILCRNTMIYFATEVSRRLIGRLHDSLEEEGWLVVGAGEHNSGSYRAFRTVNATGAKFYQKMGPSGLPPSDFPMEAAPNKQLIRLVAAPTPPALPFATPPTPRAADLAGLRQLADRGDWQGAAEYGQKLLLQDRLNPSIHFYQGLIFENIALSVEAERSLRQAIYLDRNFALAHYHLGLILKRDRRTGPASRSFGNVLKVLAGIPDDSIVTDGSGLTATGLRGLAQMHLETSCRS